MFGAEFLSNKSFLSVRETRTLAWRYRMKYNELPDSSIQGVRAWMHSSNGGRHDSKIRSHSGWTTEVDLIQTL